MDEKELTARIALSQSSLRMQPVIILLCNLSEVADKGADKVYIAFLNILAYRLYAPLSKTLYYHGTEVLFYAQPFQNVRFYKNSFVYVYGICMVISGQVLQIQDVHARMAIFRSQKLVANFWI